MILVRLYFLGFIAGAFSQSEQSASCDESSSSETSSLIQRQLSDTRSRVLGHEVCAVGVSVTCPGSTTPCAGNQCCPGSDGKTFPCPSASPDFTTCDLPSKVEDCLPHDEPEPTSSTSSPFPSSSVAPPAPAPPSPPPVPIPPVDDETMLVMNIVNREWSDGVIFCRGPSSELGGIFLDEGRTQSVVGSPVDCSNENSAAAEQWGAGVPDLTTLINLFFPQGSNWPSGTCWFQDAESNKVQSLCKGPMYQSQVEFTITSVVSWDLTSVEGVSGGLTMNYTDFTGDARNVVAIPPAFKGDQLFISKAPGAGFPTVLADKHRYGECYCPSYDPGLESCNSDACFTGCPSSLADNPCGQHRCRQWYAKSYLTDESYCGWLFSNHAQTYCWAMDEWRCLDDSCGYGGIGQPNQDCSDVLSDPNVGGRANVYSCGQQKDQKAIHGVWWEYGVGCIDKEVDDMPTNPIVPRRGGQIHISFENLPWLHVEEAE